MPKKKFPPSGVAAIASASWQVDFPFPTKNSKSQPCMHHRKAGYVVEFIPKSLPYSNLTERLIIIWGLCGGNRKLNKTVVLEGTNPAKVTPGKKGNWWLNGNQFVLCILYLQNQLFLDKVFFDRENVVIYVYEEPDFGEFEEWRRHCVTQVFGGILQSRHPRGSFWCWWCSNPVEQSSGTVVSPICFYHPNWCRISTIHKMRFDFFQKNGINGSGANTSTQDRVQQIAARRCTFHLFLLT